MKNRRSYYCVAVLGVSGAATALMILTKPGTSTAASPSCAALAVAGAATAMFDAPVSINADARHVSEGYQGYEVTEYRPMRHLITAIRTGGQRDRSIIVETDGESWVALDVSTESNTASFEFVMVNELTAEFRINNVLTSRVTSDPSGVWSTVCIEDEQIAILANSLDVLMDVATDANLNAHIEVLGPFATKGVPTCGCAAPSPPAPQMALAGLCWAPIWEGGRVKFKNCSGGFCVIPEDGTIQDCSPPNDTWIPGDGIVGPWHGLGQWFRIPGHCSATVDCAAGTIECCCNLAGMLASACFACASQCKEMDCCANPNDPCHQHGGVDCNCP